MCWAHKFSVTRISHWYDKAFIVRIGLWQILYSCCSGEQFFELSRNGEMVFPAVSKSLGRMWDPHLLLLFCCSGWGVRPVQVFIAFEAGRRGLNNYQKYWDNDTCVFAFLQESSPVNLLFRFCLLRCSVSQLIWHQRQEGEKGEEGGCLEIIWGRALITDVKIAWQQAICPPGSALVANLLLQWTSIRRALTLIIMFILLPDIQNMGRWTGSVDHKGCGFNSRLSEEAFQK